MDLKKHEKLREKINKKNFEENNKSLDKWLWHLSFFGNINSIFFAFFLVYPALKKAIAIQYISGVVNIIISLFLTIVFLGGFEIVKRYVLRNFFDEYVFNRRKIKISLINWFIISISIIALSFYLSLNGSKNLAKITTKENVVIENAIKINVDSLTIEYERKINEIDEENKKLRDITNELRRKLLETPITYVTIRKEYQTIIDKNNNIIDKNQETINNLKSELNSKIGNIESNYSVQKKNVASEERKIIFLFIIIVVFNELIIIIGIWFREYYEFKLYEINKEKFEKLYLKRDRYKALLQFVYENGKFGVGDKVISSTNLKNIVVEKSTLVNPKKIIDEFYYDMDRLGIFYLNGKRRYFNVSYKEALEIIENYNDMFFIIENIK